jgi:hypothetical protein
MFILRDDYLRLRGRSLSEGSCDEVMEVLVVRASDIAKLLSQPPEGDEISMKFGKIFEEEYALANHIYMRSASTGVPKKFIRKVAVRLKSEGIYSKELVVRAYRAYSALLKAGVVGEKPLTRFKEFKDFIFIAAQPDLYDSSTGTYYEFKLYPINDYARTQAKVFAWVLEKPIVLVGLKEMSNGYFDVEKEVINPPETLDVGPEDLKKVARTEKFCKDLKIPVHMFMKYMIRYSYEFDEELTP